MSAPEWTELLDTLRADAADESFDEQAFQEAMSAPLTEAEHRIVDEALRRADAWLKEQGL